MTCCCSFGSLSLKQFCCRLTVRSNEVWFVPKSSPLQTAFGRLPDYLLSLASFQEWALSFQGVFMRLVLLNSQVTPPFQKILVISKWMIYLNKQTCKCFPWVHCLPHLFEELPQPNLGENASGKLRRFYLPEAFDDAGRNREIVTSDFCLLRKNATPEI